MYLITFILFENILTYSNIFSDDIYDKLIAQAEIDHGRFIELKINI